MEREAADPLDDEPDDAAGVLLTASAAAAPASAADAEAATGFTSTVLFAAALLRVVRRRGEGEGVAMEFAVWKRNGNGGEREDSLSVRIPVIDDAADREIGEDLVIRAGMSGSGATGGEHPVALTGTHRIHCHQLFALGIAQDAQVHVIQSGNAEGAHQGSHDLHDLH